MKRIFAVAIIIALSMAAAQAQVSDEAMERIVALRVADRELSHRLQTRQISYDEYSAGRARIHADAQPFDDMMRRLPPAERHEVDSRITGLVKARVALLKTQWDSQAQAFKQSSALQQQTLVARVETDARRALDHQRERMRLLQAQAAGEIGNDEFTQRDRAAEQSISILRAPYEAEGPQWAREFDRRLTMLTDALGGNAETELPAATVAATEGEAPDFARDVARAADLDVRIAENDFQFEAKQIAGATNREREIAFNNDQMALRARYRDRVAEFDRAVKAASAGRIAALRAQYKGAPATAPVGGVATGTATGTEPYPTWVSVLFFIVLAGAVLVLLAALKKKKQEPVDRGPPLSDNHGTAAFAPLETEIAEPRLLARGLFLGKSNAPDMAGSAIAPGIPVCTTPEHHTLIVARTRTGKGTRVIVPTLLRYMGAMLVIDPKGENAAITARVRRDQLRVSDAPQNPVHIVNPWHELVQQYAQLGFTTATYNPLDVLDRNDPNAVALAQSFAGTICPSGANDKDRFWQGSAANMLAATFLWLADQPGEKKTLARAREIVTLPRDRLRDEYLIPMTASEAFGGAIRELIGTLVDLAPETYSGIMANLAEATKFLSDPQIKAATETSSFSMRDLVAQRTTVYLVIPPDRIETQRPWLRLVIASAMHTFKRAVARGQAAHRCMFLIDEFAALGRLDDIPRDIATMSGHGVDFALIVQGIDQLKDHYGAAASTILSNCAYKWFCNVSDLESAKYLSETLGQKTVRTTTKSESFTSGSNNASSGESTSFGEMGRSLLNPDEILNLGRDAAIVIQPNGPPHYLRPVDYWNLPEYFDHLREQHPYLYWQPPLKYDANPYHARNRGEN